MVALLRVRFTVWTDCNFAICRRPSDILAFTLLIVSTVCTRISKCIGNDLETCTLLAVYKKKIPGTIIYQDSKACVKAKQAKTYRENLKL